MKARIAKRILLVGWDAASWNLLNPALDAGELPALNRVVEEGVVGDMMAGQSLDTAAVWTTLATGKRSWRHGINHSREFDPKKQQAVAISRRPRQARALWEMLSDQGLRSIVIGWPATHGSESPLAKVVSDRYSEPTAPPGVKPWPPALPGTYCPPTLGKQLDSLRVSPADIGVDVMARYLPGWKKIDQKQDRRLGQLRVLLATDYSHFAAAMNLLRQPDWDFATVRFSAPGYMARIFTPFIPPRRPWINEREFELYHDVMRVEWRALDRMLGSLQKLAGPDTMTIVVSGHGTQMPDLPPAGFPLHEEHGWKSLAGLLAARGPGLRSDSLVHGASFFDLTPTILTAFGLPLGEDMEGRVLMEIFTDCPEIERVDSWEKDTPPPAEPAGDSASATPAADHIRRETDWNFAQSCLECGQLKEALPRLESLFRAVPENPDFCHALFQCQLNLARLDEAQETLEVLVETVPPGPASLLPQAELALARREISKARSLVDQVRKLQPTHPAALRRMGLLLLRLREWKVVEELARAVLKVNENDPIVWLGLAEASLRQQKAPEAEAAARRAIQLKYFLPEAHFILTRALVAQNKWEAARDAMSALVKLQPDNKSVAGYKKLINRQSPPGLTA